MKYFKYFIAVLVLAIAVSAFSFEPVSHTESAFLLDTYISMTAYGKNGKKALKKAVTAVQEADKRLSAFDSRSDVYKINQADENVPVKVSAETFYLISRALSLSLKTDGAFDITVKPLMDLWGFGTENAAVPKDENIKNALDTMGYDKLILDEENKTVTKIDKNTKIDLGGIAKGYCCDLAADILKKEGVENAYLDFGGNVVTLGKMPLGLVDAIKNGGFYRDFSVGIQNPEKLRGEIFEKVTAKEEKLSIVTSGGYERNFEYKGKLYHHILDPKTGAQPENDVLSVTVISQSSETADAFSTALFVMGPEKAQSFKDFFVEAVFYMKTGEIIRIKS